MSKQKQTEFETELQKVGSYINVFEPTDKDMLELDHDMGVFLDMYETKVIRK